MISPVPGPAVAVPLWGRLTAVTARSAVAVSGSMSFESTSMTTGLSSFVEAASGAASGGSSTPVRVMVTST